MKPEEIENKVQELQILEQNLQGFLMQRQTVQVELNEISNALAELKKADDEVYKVLSGIMVKSDKSSLIKDLEERKRVTELRMNSIEKQEKILSQKADDLRKEISLAMSEKKK
jgi:prefoldin beta subunit